MTLGSDNLQGKLSFNFNRAVRDARRDYPVETENITFIDSSHKTRDEQVNQFSQWIEATSPAFKDLLLKDTTARSLAALMLLMYGGTMSLKDPVSGKGILIAPGNPEENPLHKLFSPALSSEETLAYSFYHELGHLIIDEGLANTLRELELCSDFNESQSLRRRGEIFADSFAGLYGLQAGFLDKNKVQQLSSIRKAGDAIHDTAEALSALIEARDEMTMAPLGPQEIKRAAVTHAKKFTAR